MNSFEWQLLFNKTIRELGYDANSDDWKEQDHYNELTSALSDEDLLFVINDKKTEWAHGWYQAVQHELGNRVEVVILEDESV